MARRWTFLGHLIVLGIVAVGAAILWNNIWRGAAPPSDTVAGLADAAERVGIDADYGATRRQAPAGSGQVIVAPSGLAIPVDSIEANELVDTYTQSRAGGARVHNAIDIMAPRGTPVIAAAPGTVERLFFSRGGGGITAYVRSPDRNWIYYYAHLDAYAPGLREGVQIQRGSSIGTVGFTGNANPEGPHLHFAVHRMASGEDWHEGTPVNPYPLLAGKQASR